MGLTKAEKEQRAELDRKARQEREVERQEELKQREAVKAEFEALYESHRQKILPQFDVTIIQKPTAPNDTAVAISKEFPALQVSVVYENGNSVIRVQPKKVAIQMPGYQQTVETIMSQWPQGVEGQWPSVQVVKAFAQGFDQGFEYADRRAKNKATDREIEDQYHHHPYFKMMRGYWGG